MNCNFGPYQITTKLETVGENTFIDNSKSKQVVIFGNCNPVTPPCVDAVILKKQDSCPQCDIVWFDCPSIMGREYTILTTPCGVTITSFNDGLVSLQGCDATDFGSGHFCFGYIYSSAGKFKSNDESSVSFIFDGHAFLVRGNPGICSDDMFVCDECQSGSSDSMVTAFATLPTPPDAPLTPVIVDGVVEEVGVDDVPVTKVIPAEGRTIRDDTKPDAEGENFDGNSFCEKEREINTGVSPPDWAGGELLGNCESNDNPAIATLPSGHTIIAYEQRSENGLTKINLAILPSSVNKNIRYYRSMSRGTFLNSSELEFEIYDEINVVLPVEIGFLTGPLKGAVRSVSDPIRTVDGARTKIVFKVAPGVQNPEFPDKNDVHDVGWFLMDSQGSDELPPPSTINVTTVLELPDHKDATGTIVPVAHPSVAVARNNLMTMPEQNIYVTYQAFEGDEWRVYLREILLGSGTLDADGQPGDIPPIYVAPYLFDDDSQRTIEIVEAMQSVDTFTHGNRFGDMHWFYDFGSLAGQGRRIGELNDFAAIDWYEEVDHVVAGNATPLWTIWDEQENETVNVVNSSIHLCSSSSMPGELLPCEASNAITCMGVWNSRLAAPETCIVTGPLAPGEITPFTRAFAVKSSNVLSEPGKNISVTMRFAIRCNCPGGIDDPDSNNDTLPEIWFTFGTKKPPNLDTPGLGWKIQILRGTQSRQIIPSTGWSHDRLNEQGPINNQTSCNCDGNSDRCFIFRLYDGFSRKRPNGMSDKADLSENDGSASDVVVREIWQCIPEGQPNGDYDMRYWNEWSVETYTIGRKRIFDIYLKNVSTNYSLMATFQEWDPELIRNFPLDSEFDIFHGFGLYHSNNLMQVVISDIRCEELLTPSRHGRVLNNDPLFQIFYEDDLAADGHWDAIPHLTFNNMQYILKNPADPSVYTGWTYSQMRYGVGDFDGDTFYNRFTTQPSSHGGHARLQRSTEDPQIPDGAQWSYTKIADAPTADPVSGEEINNIAMYLSVAGEPVNSAAEDAFPHVWFVFRLLDQDAGWWSGYRIRVSKFKARSSMDAASLTTHAGTRPAIALGDKYWRVQLFEPRTEAFSGPEDEVPVDQEAYVRIVTLSPGVNETFADYGTKPSLHQNPDNSQEGRWPFLKVECTIEQGPFVRFKIYAASVVGDFTDLNPAEFDGSDLIFTGQQLVHAFDTADVFGDAQPRIYHGFALFDGSATEPELDNADHATKAILNYIKLQRLDDTPDQRGACCRADGRCEVTSDADCDQNNGDRWAVGEDCGSFDCTALVPTGAACNSQGNCLDGVTELAASNAGYGVCGEGIDCSWIRDLTCGDGGTRNCPQPTVTGSCCRPNTTVGCVDGLTIEECSVFFGSGGISPGRWRSDTLCSSELQCPDTVDGACCTPGIGCQILTQAQCNAIPDAAYQGDGTDCGNTGDNVCVGACCDAVDACTDVDEQTCLDAGSTFHGYGTLCATVVCATPNEIAACCHLNDTCSDTEESVCDGEWHTGELCADDPSPCPNIDPLGACCNQLINSCTSDLTSSECDLISNSLWLGAGTNCATNPCPPVVGACCWTRSGFQVCTNDLTIPECVSLEDGIWQGPFIQCVPDMCDPIGPSFLPDPDVLGSSPYVNNDITYKPEDLWRVEVGDEEYVTRVLYHMREEIEASSSTIEPDGSEGGSNQVDFMFLIDHSSSMLESINKVQIAVPILAEGLVTKGFDVRFGFIVFARGIAAVPTPDNRIECLTNPPQGQERRPFQYIFNGLQRSLTCWDEDPNAPGAGISPGHSGGFTRSVDDLRKALDCWEHWRVNPEPPPGGIVVGASTHPWTATRYAVSKKIDSDSSFPDPTINEFEWRPNSEKFIFFASDADDTEATGGCGAFADNKARALEKLQTGLSSPVKFIPAISFITEPGPDPLLTDDRVLYGDFALDTGWEGGVFDVTSEDYGLIFETVISEIDTVMRVDRATVVERAKPGTEGTFLKKAEVIITYDGDLTDLWTFNKSDFEFRDAHVPFDGTNRANTKDLSNFPFVLATEQIYGIESVHIQGIQSNWVSFGNEGPLNYDHEAATAGGFGFRASGAGDPILVATNSSRPKVFVNNRNQVIVAYENYSSGVPNIELKGTGDFHQDSIIGPKASRIQRFLTPSDFAYSHAITLPTTTIDTTDSSDPYNVIEGAVTTVGTSEGLSQLCDFIIDNSDITHIVWQSNASGYWEIYYANSSNTFIPVQVTKSESRSSHPSISVDETGSVFVVYHDDRFGPFNIMLASKDEERVIPLLEQDAYLASLKHKYVHYTNILPVLIDNPAGTAPVLGQFWASKVTGGAGNDQENAVYQLSETTGTPSSGKETTDTHDYIAFSSQNFYSVKLDGTLFRLGTVTEKIVTILDTPTTIGTIEKEVDDFENARILDMTVDRFDRLWILIFETAVPDPDTPSFATTPSDLPLVRSFGLNDRLRLIQVSPIDAATLSTGIVFNGEVDVETGAGTGSVTVTSDNKFHITFEQGGDNVLATSDYPSITVIVGTSNDRMADFDFSVIGGFGGDLGTALAVSMTHNATDALWIVTSENDLYTLNKTTGAATFQVSLTSPSGSEVALPVGTTSGVAFQDLEVESVGGEEFFNIRLDFYDNIAFEGDPFLVIDSRDQLEAFINEQVLDDPYIDVQGLDARGTFLEVGETGVVFFDSSHFVPGFSNLSQPYTFEPNQTYFARVFVIPPNGHPRESGLDQNSSFSCSKCSRFGNNNFNASSCSYSFSSNNDDTDDLFFNYQIDFYADSEKQHIIRRFEAKPGSPDLAYMEVDNKPAISEWGTNGLLIPAGGAKFIQIHPVLDTQAGFLCGVQYTVHVNQCLSSDSECFDYVEITPGRWSGELIGDQSQNVSTDLSGNPPGLMPGLSIATFDGDIIVAWIDNNNNLLYGRFDGKFWNIQTVPVPGFTGRVRYCSISVINNLPAIAYVTLRDSSVRETVLGNSDVIVLTNGQWIPYLNGTRINGPIATTPRSLIEFNGLPLLVFASDVSDTADGIQIYAGDSESTLREFDSGGGFCDDQGGCVISIALIDGTPAIAAVARNTIVFGNWDGTIFNPVEVISGSDDPVLGRIGIADIGGQPAVAYLRNEGNLQRLMYRKLNGDNWEAFDVTGSKTFNKHVALASINDQPVIAYTIQTESGTTQLWVAVFNGVYFANDLVDEITTTSAAPLLDLVQYGTGIALVASANPFKIYLFRQFASSSDTELRPVFFCECSSKIFTNRLTHLSEVARWESSAHGFADTRVTDSTEDSLRPVIQTRPSGAAIILWEDKNVSEHCTSPPCVRAATFRNVNQDQLRGSGTKSWFDYDFGISGQDVSLTLDLFDRVNAVYETKIDPNELSGFHGKGESKNELPRNKLKAKVCDFAEAGTIQSGPDDTIDPVRETPKLEGNVISFDQFISEQIVRKIRVKDEFVSYYTYNASKTLTPIVSVCNIVLEIHGTPEIVAIRLRGENNASFSPWFAWSPQIGDYVMEKEYTISKISGIKEVCVQAMTYNGITTEFCLPIVADYESVVFETRFFSNRDTTGTEVSISAFTGRTGEQFSIDESTLVLLPLSEGISVANLAPIPAPSLDKALRETVTILVEIIPNQSFEDPDDIRFDVIQQGSGDIFGENAVRGINAAGRVVYRGVFVIKREDKVSNVDGLARINPKFPNACETSGGNTGSGVEVTNVFMKDDFNVVGQQASVEATETTEIVDALAEFRQAVSGRIGTSVDIRPSNEDPFFIFGDPDYSLKTTEGRRIGVPFDVAQADISTGELVEQDQGFCPPPGPAEENFGCPEGFRWLPRIGLNGGCCCTDLPTDDCRSDN